MDPPLSRTPTGTFDIFGSKTICPLVIVILR